LLNTLYMHQSSFVLSNKTRKTANFTHIKCTHSINLYYQRIRDESTWIINVIHFTIYS